MRKQRTQRSGDEGAGSEVYIYMYGGWGRLEDETRRPCDCVCPLGGLAGPGHSQPFHSPHLDAWRLLPPSGHFH